MQAYDSRLYKKCMYGISLLIFSPILEHKQRLQAIELGTHL